MEICEEFFNARIRRQTRSSVAQVQSLGKMLPILSHNKHFSKHLSKEAEQLVKNTREPI